ncbi:MULTISPECIES: hypothetical protein [unclassified Thioalkalivibrio]|uniref:hypothetical protein n=1 Tax=unclassified Thioalkalivibrio TaxID=2621013 RepID=UPI00037813F0|nr:MULTISPECIES: hypothetical protein [unclassified Thioalkalivibrio]
METKTISGRRSRRAASLFDIGNVIVISVAGIPLFLVGGDGVGVGFIIAAIVGIVPLILWFGGSMVVYALNKHHPDPRVGHHTQWAAYRLYGLMGALIVVATFFPPDIDYYRAYWAVAAVILLPWSLYALYTIYREPWSDIEVPAEADQEHHL